ncbi:MAG: Na+/H+ antiporter subunit E [Anaerolineae bacterium]|jgi:multicomponent Na+:H+ antiporter subunit E
MTLFVINILLALVWVALTQSFTAGNFVLGYTVGFLALLALTPEPREARYFATLRRAVLFLAFYLAEMVVSNIRVTQVVLQPKPRIRPAVVAVPLDAKSDAEITLLANLITFTPGSLSLDVSSDRKVLYVHGMDVPDRDAFVHYVKDGLERRVIELMR